MISYSQIQSIASDVEFVATMVEASTRTDDDDAAAWWYESGKLERQEFARTLKLAAEILNTLTVEQVESLPSYLRAA